jgi:hypothetical protein
LLVEDEKIISIDGFLPLAAKKLADYSGARAYVVYK